MWGHDSLRGAFADVLGGSNDHDDHDDHDDPPESRPDGGTQQVVAPADPPVSLDVSVSGETDGSAGVDVDIERLEAALNEAVTTDGSATRSSSTPGRVRAAAGSQSTVTPVVATDQDDLFDQDPFGTRWGRHIRDETIQNLAENSVNYTPEIADWMLAHDDLVPGVMSRFKALLLGGEGLAVDPSDPDDEADKRLAEHLRAIYHGDDAVETHVVPGDVIEHALAANIQHARAVLRATDLEPVALETLDYAKDGATGEAVYIQESTDYTTIEIADDGSVSTTTKHTDAERALRIGEDVFEARLYRTPPLRAVANDVVNKLQLKRLKARKAEIASIGGLYITVTPPPWLQEAEYTDVVPSDKHNYGDASLTKLEISMRNDLGDALDTLQQYQTATVMSVPDHWEVGTIDLPEMDTSFDDMVRGYNDAISRRLLLPLDLLELEKGSELSRNSMIELLFSMMAGWQRELVGVFDGFGATQADIHDMNGSVEHRLPSITPEDEKQIVSLLNYAGLLGLSESESRQMANTLEGVDLDESPELEESEDLPPVGGPDDPSEREASMRESIGPQGAEAAASYSEGDVVEYDADGHIGLVLEKMTEDFTEPVGDEDDRDVEASGDDPAYIVARETEGFGVFRTDDLSEGTFPDDIEGDPGELAEKAEAGAIEADRPENPWVGFRPGEPEGWTRLSFLRAYASVGGSWTSCVADMTGEVSRPKRWCSALKDTVYGTERWRGRF